jgi:hypothetical protein
LPASTCCHRHTFNVFGGSPFASYIPYVILGTKPSARMSRPYRSTIILSVLTGALSCTFVAAEKAKLPRRPRHPHQHHGDDRFRAIAESDYGGWSGQ